MAAYAYGITEYVMLIPSSVKSEEKLRTCWIWAANENSGEND